MPMGIQLCMILPRGPCTWPNTRKHRIAGRHKRRAGRIRRSLKRQFCTITALTGGNRHITTPMGQMKRLVTGQRKEAAMGRSRGIIGRINDMWIDVPEQMVRYLTVDLNPEGTGQTRLIPINFCKINDDRVTVRSIYGANFAAVPQHKAASEITLLEEEKIMAYYGGGTLYADPARSEPKL